MTGSEELIRQARSNVGAGLSSSPRRRTAVIACIDSRVEPNSILGGVQGDYHVIRNAGGVITDDVLRSLLVSQYHGTSKVVVMMHTDCGALAYPAEEERRRIETETGQRMHFDMHPFDDTEAELARGVERIRQTPFLAHRDNVKGVIYDVHTGRLRTVMD